MSDKNKFIIILSVFIAAYFLPFTNPKVQSAIMESFLMLQDYAQKHVILCLLPAFFIAGAIGVFIASDSVMKYLGPKANKAVAYLVASVSGTILAVCSCTILPLFAGIHKKGAGLGPATAFLYSGPAINVLAIILTAKILGYEIGLARAVAAITLSIVIGLLMQLTFPESKNDRQTSDKAFSSNRVDSHSNAGLFFVSMVAILIFANWPTVSREAGYWYFVYKSKWIVTSIFALLFAYSLNRQMKIKISRILISFAGVLASSLIFYKIPAITFAVGIAFLVWMLWTGGDEAKNWLDSVKGFAFQIMPLLFAGIMVAGFLLGMPGGNGGVVPSSWIASLVGGNSLFANFFAAVAGAFMYFATLTEVPILQGLIGSGMGKGPALSLLLAGPALSLPNMLVIRSVLGTKKTVVYIVYVIILSTAAGVLFGLIR